MKIIFNVISKQNNNKKGAKQCALAIVKEQEEKAIHNSMNMHKLSLQITQKNIRVHFLDKRTDG